MVPEASFGSLSRAVGQGQCQLGAGSVGAARTLAPSYLQDAPSTGVEFRLPLPLALSFPSLEPVGSGSLEPVCVRVCRSV